MNISPQLIRVEVETFETKSLPPRPVKVERAGRGTSGGLRLAADKLLKPVKTVSRRADFLRAICNGESSIARLQEKFGMTRANFNAFLTHIHKDHGIGYAKDDQRVQLLCPRRVTPKNCGL